MSIADVVLHGLADVEEYFKRMPETTTKAAQLAINQVATRGALKLAQDSIYDEVNFPQGYLKGDRLGVTQYAKENNLEAVITARKRATSLARFTNGQALGSVRKAGVRVQVKRGSSVHLKRAWLVRLNKGASLDEDNYNVGLAVRVKEGESIVGKHGTHSSWLIRDKVALLYGPSVDQIFRDVSGEIAPQVGDLLADEFFRQFERLSR